MICKRFFPLLLFITLLTLSHCPAQSGIDTLKLNFETFTIKDGLSQGMVSSILEDKEGFMWFATKDGLNKYDGYHVTVYRNDPKDPHSLPDNYVKQLAEDEKGNFWVGTGSKSLCLFDKKKEKFYPVNTDFSENKLINDGISRLEYKDGKLLVVKSSDAMILDVSSVSPADYSEKALSKIKPVFMYNTIQVNPSRKIKLNNRYYLHWMKDGAVWLSFADSVFICTPVQNQPGWTISGLSYTSFGLPGKTAARLNVLKGENKLFLQQDNKLFVFDRKKNKLIYSAEIYGIRIGDMGNLIDQNGNAWFSTSSGDFCFNSNTFKLNRIISGTSSVKSWVTTYVDHTGVFWVGTNGTGILMYNNRKERFHTFPILSFGNFIENKNGEISMQLRDNREVNFNPYTGNLKNVEHLPSNDNFDFRPILMDKKGNYWFLFIIKGQHYLGSCSDDNSSGGNNYIQHPVPVEYIKLINDNNDRLWVLSHGKDNSRNLIQYDKQTNRETAVYRFPIKNDNHEYPFISDWRQDKNDVFWFGTIQGIFSFNEKKNEWHQWKNNPNDSLSLSADMVISLCPDPKQPDKYLWAGTNGGGFNRFEFATGKCIRYSEREGLPNNVVYGILSDKFGNLWMSTNKGLSCFNPETGKFRNFTEEDGLQGDEFNRYEYMKLKSGNLLFGGIKGFTIFNPAEVLRENPAPYIVLTGLSIYNKPVSYKTDRDILSMPVGYTNSITLPYNNNMFSIEFAALESSPADKKHYKYFLKGFDKNRIDNGTKNTATYTNLDPGAYEFNVTGSNSDGVWNEKGASVKIIITPPWWATWWFRLSVIILLFSVVYGFYRYRLNQVLKLLAIRNSIASDLHDEIGSTLSSISLSSTIIQKKMTGNTAEVKTLLNQISTSTDNMMEAMSDIVWSINTKNDRFDNVTNRMRAFAIEILEPENSTVIFNSNSALNNLKLNMAQRKNLYLIFKEAINNVAKYAHCKNVWIDIYLQGNKKMVLKIKDDGKGFDTSSLLHLEGKGVFGGNGLNNIRKRAAEIKGNAAINSSPGIGTEVFIEFPL